MRRLLILTFLAVFMSTSLTACATFGKWYDDLKTDPVTTTERFIATAENVVRAAEVTLMQLITFLPEAQQRVYLSKYEQASLAVTEAVAAVRAGVQAAAELKEEEPNLSKVLSDLSRAVLKVKDVIDEVRNLVAKSNVPGLPPVGSTTDGNGNLIRDPFDRVVTDFRLDAIRAGASPNENF